MLYDDSNNRDENVGLSSILTMAAKKSFFILMC